MPGPGKQGKQAKGKVETGEIEIAVGSVHAALCLPRLAHDLVRKNNYRFRVREWVRHEMAPLAVAVVHVKPRYLALTEK